MVSEDDPRKGWRDARSGFVEALRAARMDCGLSQSGLAEAVGRGLTSNAYKKYEWRDGQSLPDQERVEQIVEVLGAEASHLIGLRDEADEARNGWRKAQSDRRPEAAALPHFIPWEGYSLRELFRRSVEAVGAHCLRLDVDGKVVAGWRHFLQKDELPITAMASSYGLRILLMANHVGADPSFDEIRNSIMEMEHEGHGWSARTQSRMARVEAYGPILMAMRLAGLSDEDFNQRVEHYEEVISPDFDRATWIHTAILTTACNTLSKVKPESPRIPELLEALRAAVREDGDDAYWTSSVHLDRVPRLNPSVVHTARAICCIHQAPTEMVDKELIDLMTRAVRWLQRQEHYHNESEFIERTANNDDRDHLNMMHFAAAWVGRALAYGSAWTAIDPVALRRAEERILRAVEPDGLWRWETGEQPIWMTYQGLRAIREIAFAEYDIKRVAD